MIIIIIIIIIIIGRRIRRIRMKFEKSVIFIDLNVVIYLLLTQQPKG